LSPFTRNFFLIFRTIIRVAENLKLTTENISLITNKRFPHISTLNIVPYGKVLIQTNAMTLHGPQMANRGFFRVTKEHDTQLHKLITELERHLECHIFNENPKNNLIATYSSDDAFYLKPARNMATFNWVGQQLSDGIKSMGHGQFQFLLDVSRVTHAEDGTRLFIRIVQLRHKEVPLPLSDQQQKFLFKEDDTIPPPNQQHVEQLFDENYMIDENAQMETSKKPKPS